MTKKHHMELVSLEGGEGFSHIPCLLLLGISEELLRALIQRVAGRHLVACDSGGVRGGVCLIKMDPSAPFDGGKRTKELCRSFSRSHWIGVSRKLPQPTPIVNYPTPFYAQAPPLPPHPHSSPTPKEE